MSAQAWLLAAAFAFAAPVYAQHPQSYSDARALGAKVVEAERALDAFFDSGTDDAQRLAALVRAAAAARGEYRLSHLETHRRMKALLTPDQVARYDALRG